MNSWLAAGMCFCVGRSARQAAQFVAEARQQETRKTENSEDFFRSGTWTWQSSGKFSVCTY